MGIFKRLFNIGQAEANSAIDKLEDPIKMTEQGLRDLKNDLDQALHGLAEVKAMAIRSKNDVETYKSKAKDYENKAMLLLKKAQAGDLEASEADRLASDALVKKEESLEQMNRSKKDYDQFERNVSQMDHNVKKIRSTISQFENELKTLKARVKVSAAAKKINKQLTQIDSSGTVSLLERMKDKVAQDEALAESYGEIANESKSVDEEIDKALSSGTGDAKVADDLAEMKAKLGLDKEDSKKE